MPILQDIQKSPLELSKEYFSTMNQNSVRRIQINADTNVFALIMKADNEVGRIELNEVSSGNTAIYKRGYYDSDWVLVS